MRRSDLDCVKIGIAFKPDVRAATLSKELGASVEVVHTEPHASAALVERMAHWILREHRIKRHRTDWFWVSIETAKGAIRDASLAVQNPNWTPPWPTGRMPSEIESPKTSAHIGLRIEADLKASLQELADAEQRTLSNYIYNILRGLVREAGDGEGHSAPTP